MNFSMPLIPAILKKREKRFLSYCSLGDGQEVVAHCPNSGSMKGNQQRGSRVWLHDFGPGHLSQGKKLRYKWVMVESAGIKVVIDTHCANPLVAEGFQKGLVPGLEGRFQREYSIGSSRLDFFFPGPPEIYVEVKSVSMGEGDLAAFPDAVTERGQKHLLELTALAKAGKRAVLFFLLLRENTMRMRIAREIDPEYFFLLQEARKEGVEIMVYGTKMSQAGLELGAKGSLDEL